MANGVATAKQLLVRFTVSAIEASKLTKISIGKR